MFILLVLLAAVFAAWLVAVITAFVVFYSAAAKRPEHLGTFALSFPLLILWVNYRLGLPPIAFWYFQVSLTVIGFIALRICILVCSLEPPFLQQTATRMGTVAALFFLAAMFFPFVWTVVEGRQQFRNLPTFRSQSIVRIPAADCPREPRAEYVHVSDLHFTAGQARTRDNEIPGDVRANELLTVLAGIQPDVVFVTGDITDTGSDAQWLFAEKFFREIEKATGALVLLAPGNHDFSPALTESATGRFNDNTVRAVSFLSMASRIMPDVISAADDELNTWFAKAPAKPDIAAANDEQSRIDWCVANAQSENARSPGTVADPQLFCEYQVPHPQLKAFENYTKYWLPLVNGAFPLHYSRGTSAYIILATTLSVDNRITHNALGEIDDGQLRRLDSLLGTIPNGFDVYLLLHHPIARPDTDKFSFPLWGTFEDWEDSTAFAYSLLRLNSVRANRLLSTLEQFNSARPESRVIVMFGHRHVTSLGLRQYRTKHGWGQMTFEEEQNLGNPTSGFFVKRAFDAQPVWCKLE
jgi:3',5'-cyclic AMP phosphodiesterase CpdA